MANEANRVVEQLRQLNAKLTLNQKISMIAFGMAVIVGIGVMVHFMNLEEYQTLYSNLNSEEASTVINRLKDLKIPYQLTDLGKTIKVPPSKVDELRIQLASEGLPQTGKIGFEIFDKTNLGMTEFLEKVSYKRALEGELARTILSLKEVAQARVHLVLPKESLFEEKSEPTKASVVIKLNAGKQISEGMVSGIVHLVSSAVEGLNPQNVTVVDISGLVLSAKAGSAEEALSASQLELKTQHEKDLMQKIVYILEPVVGEGKVKADASVVLNFNRSEQTEEKYNPQETVIRSQQKSEERVDPLTTPSPAGVPGTKSNQSTPPPNVTPISGRTATSSQKRNETTNYEISKLVRHTVEPVGDVRRFSVAVIVDDALKIEKGPDGSPVKKTIPRSVEELKKIKDLVSAAIGLDVKRGDQLTVENIAFDIQYMPDEAKPTFYQKWKDVIQPAIKYGAFLILFMLIYFLLIRPVTRKVFAPAEEILGATRDEAARLEEKAEPNPLALDAPKTVKELEESLGTGSMMLPEAEITKFDILRKRIVDFIEKEPENAAQIFRLWLDEEAK